MRLDPSPLILGHWRGLSNVDEHGEYKGPDYVTRTILVLSSALAGVAVWYFHVSFAAPTALLSGFALMSGVLLAVFAQLATMRVRLTDRDDDSRSRRVLKDSLDESVSHVLVAAFLGVLASGVIVVAMSVTHPISPAQPEIEGPWAITLAPLAVYEALLLVILIPRLYSAYTRVNDVARELNGYVGG
ncbi:Uncharacterised protein [Mycobacteroides abscessus subsp. massiliense]|uniref:hypothetical protein n=1 Tax=Mycobacteroides abscessus TaxID=36809 RepID=UPI0009C4F51D|nr:hypothetical protein [Mycobacteroides abscessus]SKS10192.1 Uncharacterised protein [Mycobacteroides abscessus subsp. massiliense]